MLMNSRRLIPARQTPSERYSDRYSVDWHPFGTRLSGTESYQQRQLGITLPGFPEKSDAKGHVGARKNHLHTSVSLIINVRLPASFCVARPKTAQANDLTKTRALGVASASE